MSKHPPIDPAYINERLQVLVGLPLIRMWRPACQAFEFGGRSPTLNKRGQEIMISDYRVDFLGEWRVTQGCTVILGSNDHGGKRRFYDRKTPPKSDPLKGVDARIRWSRAKELLKLANAGALRVLSVDFDSNCVLRIQLTDGYSIAGFKCDSDWNAQFFFDMNKEADGSIFVTPDSMLVHEGDD